jgi:hypothetical protein
MLDASDRIGATFHRKRGTFIAECAVEGGGAMQLIKAHVTNFRSVEDSGPFSLEQVTSLVGKNEAGKSAVLLALGALNPHAATPLIFDKERD